MADDSTKWTVFPDWRTTAIDRDTWSACPVQDLTQVLISGDIAKAIASLAPNATEAGLWTIADTVSTLVRIGRDRALLATTTPLTYVSGWHADGWAASRADDAFFVIDLHGPGLPELVSEATTADVASGSHSAAILFAGVTGYLYRRSATTARLHIDAALAPYVWRWLETR